MSFSFSSGPGMVAFAKVTKGEDSGKTLYYNTQPIYSDANIKKLLDTVTTVNNGLPHSLRMDKAGISAMCEALIAGVPGKCNKAVFDAVKLSMRAHDLGNAYINMAEGAIVPIPRDIQGQTEVIYVTGPQGVGKSYFINEYASNYKKMFKNNAIVMFSRNSYDPSIDDEIITRINKNKLLEFPWDIEEHRDALYVFDDIEGIQSKDEKIAVLKILNDAILNGRKLGIRVLYGKHQARDYKETRDILLEASAYVIFPGQADKQNIGLMRDFMGMGPKEIKAINSRATRWIMLTKTNPQMIITQTGVYMRSYFKE